MEHDQKGEALVTLRYCTWRHGLARPTPLLQKQTKRQLKLNLHFWICVLMGLRYVEMMTVMVAVVGIRMVPDQIRLGTLICACLSWMDPVPCLSFTAHLQSISHGLHPHRVSLSLSSGGHVPTWTPKLGTRLATNSSDQSHSAHQYPCMHAHVNPQEPAQCPCAFTSPSRLCHDSERVQTKHYREQASTEIRAWKLIIYSPSLAGEVKPKGRKRVQLWLTTERERVANVQVSHHAGPDVSKSKTDKCNSKVDKYFPISMIIFQYFASMFSNKQSFPWNFWFETNFFLVECSTTHHPVARFVVVNG